MRWIWLPLILLTAVHAQPPSPPGFTPVLSPKQKELKESWGTPMIKVSYSPGIPVPLTGFAITNLSVANNQVSLSWINGVPPFQVIGEPTLYGPWNDVGNPTTARSKVFPEDINHFFTVQGGIVMPLEATRTNNLTRLTWEAPDIDMGDSLQQFTLKRSTDGGATFPNTVAVVQPGGTYSVDDSTAIPPGGSLTWELLEQTLNGVVVPYSKPVASNNAPGTALWAKGYGGVSHDIGNGVAVDSSGAIYACGTYDSSANFGTGTLPAFSTGAGWLAKYAPAGVPIWAKAFGIGAGVSANCTVTLTSITVRGGFVAITGTFSGTVDFSSTESVAGASKSAIGAHDLFIALYTDAGAYVWVKTFGTATLDSFGAKLDCAGRSVAIGNSGNVFTTGSFSGAVNFGDATRTSVNGSSIFGLCLAAANGSTVWSIKLGGDTAVSQTGWGIAVDSSDAIFMTGAFSGANIDFGNGHTISSPSTTTAIFVAKYRGADAECLWANAYGGNNFQSDTGLTVAVDSSGNIAVGGMLFSAGENVGGSALVTGAFLAKYDGGTGAHTWSVGFSVGGVLNPNLGWMGGVARDQNNDFVIIGAAIGSVTIGTTTASPPALKGMFIFKLNGSSGVPKWGKMYGSTGGPFATGGPCWGSAIAVGPDNSPAIVGVWVSVNVSGTAYSLSMDSIAITPLANEDVLLAKLAP